jgi:hypothetical protein
MNELQISELLDWEQQSDGSLVAEPNSAFWAEWRANKRQVKDQGFAVRPLPGSRWQVSWSPVSEEATERYAVIVAKPVALPPVGNLSPLSEASVDELIAKCFPQFAGRKWSEEQYAIFQWFRLGSGNLVVSARAGTGKTTTIKVAFAFAPEQSCCYLVFNKKNELEAREAIKDKRVKISTLHAIGYYLIRMVWAGVSPDDSVEDDRVDAVCPHTASDELKGAVKKLVAFAKNLYVHPSLEELASLAEIKDLVMAGMKADLLAMYASGVLELSLQRDSKGRISFNDMVWLPVAANWVRPLFDLVVVDEAQDMNLPQLLMAHGLVRKNGRCVVVGDDRQCIYSFRGALPDGLGMMRERLRAKDLSLSITYRCPKAVVRIANNMVPDYYAADSAPEGIVSQLGIEALPSAMAVGDAVLSRLNAPLMPLCLSMIRRGISARIEGRDIGQQLCNIVKKFKASSVPHFIERLEKWRKNQINRFSGSQYAEAKTEQINDQAATILAVAEDAKNVQEIMDKLAGLFQDSNGFQKPAVVFSSVHKAKGLEWNRVAILEDTFRSKEGTGEEANVYYVAVTRSKSELIQVWGKKEAPAEG